jgi:hypothetical protein
MIQVSLIRELGLGSKQVTMEFWERLIDSTVPLMRLDSQKLAVLRQRICGIRLSSIHR